MQWKHDSEVVHPEEILTVLIVSSLWNIEICGRLCLEARCRHFQVRNMAILSYVREEALELVCWCIIYLVDVQLTNARKAISSFGVALQLV